MDLPDATLMFLVEAAGYPAVAGLAQSAYERLVAGEDVGYRVLQDLVGEASGPAVSSPACGWPAARDGPVTNAAR